ncbi:MAG: SRPBCC family protein [Phycisphaerales bacterium JB039]
MTIRAPQQAVFDAICDLEGAPERISAIRKVEVLTDGPVGKGTRWRETRQMFGKECTEEMEITEFDPPHGYAMGADNCGCHYDSRFSVRPDGDKTIVEMTFRAIPTSLKGRLMMPMGLLMLPMMKKCVRQDLEDLKAHVEGAATAAASAQPA